MAKKMEFKNRLPETRFIKIYIEFIIFKSNVSILSKKTYHMVKKLMYLSNYGFIFVFKHPIPKCYKSAE